MSRRSDSRSAGAARIKSNQAESRCKCRTSIRVGSRTLLSHQNMDDGSRMLYEKVVNSSSATPPFCTQMRVGCAAHSLDAALGSSDNTERFAKTRHGMSVMSQSRLVRTLNVIAKLSSIQSEGIAARASYAAVSSVLADATRASRCRQEGQSSTRPEVLQRVSDHSERCSRPSGLLAKMGGKRREMVEQWKSPDVGETVQF